MSSRAMRKLQGGGGMVSSLASKEEGGEEVEGDEEMTPARQRNGARNAFSLLLAASCSDTEVKEDDGEESSRPQGSQETTKKKKRRKKKTGKKMATRSSEDNLDLDEVEASVRWVESTLGPVSSEGQQRGGEAGTSDSNHILRVENRFLNPENEMKRIFGSRVVQSENSRSKKQRGSRTFQRGSVLVTPKPSWPNPRGGLSMRTMDSDQDGSWFTWDHSPQYQAVQLDFLTAVDSMDPRRIMDILNHNPMHIDSMLQFSEICKMGEDSAMAAELIERTLYALESTFHFSFSLANPSCHLDYRRQENRSFFIALFRHISFVSARACYRTALELTKVLLNLDPKEDPLAGILMVDFFALRAREYQWLVDFYNNLEKQRNLSQLPNMMYSLALATYQLAISPDQSKESADRLQKSADQLLQDALISFPDVLLPLLDKCSVDVPMSVSTHAYFMDTRATPPALATLCTLFVERNYHCWKEPEVLPWLETNCNAVIDLIDNKVDKVTESIEHRRIRYQGLPRNIHRHVLMSEFQSAVSKLPGNLARAVDSSWDPLPPLNGINTYTRPNRAQTLIDDPSSLRLFFRSMLPNFNPDEPVPAEGEGGARGEGAGEGGIDLRNSVQNLVGALRDLLGNIEVVDAPGEAGDEASEDEPGEWD